MTTPVGIALGQFDPSASEAKLKAQKVPVFEVQGFHLYAFGSGAAAGDILFVFFDANTAAFGNRSVLEHLINVRMGGEETLLTGKLFPLISEANGNGIIWAILDKEHTHLAMQQLVPQASQFPQAAAIIERMHAMIININADDGVDAHFQAVCDSVDDANLLSAAMQAGLMYRRYQEAQTNPALAKTHRSSPRNAQRRPPESGRPRKPGTTDVANPDQGLRRPNVGRSKPS